MIRTGYRYQSAGFQIRIEVQLLTLMRVQIQLFTSVRIRIRIPLMLLRYLRPLAYRPSRPLFWASTPSFWASTALQGSILSLESSCILTLLRIWVRIWMQLFTLMRIRIQLPKTIGTDPDPEPCKSEIGPDQHKYGILYKSWSAYVQTCDVLFKTYWCDQCKRKNATCLLNILAQKRTADKNTAVCKQGENIHPF